MRTDLPGRVVVLAGGLGHEREVSLRSGRRVVEALHDVGVEASTADLDGSLLAVLTADPPDVVFPVLHGGSGEDGAVRELLDVLALAYVGATPAACRVAFDKPTAKSVVAAGGVATPISAALPQALFRDLGAASVLDALVDRLGLPLAVKPARGGSALGFSAVRKAEDLPAAMVACFSYGETALVERLIEGTEIAVSVVDTGDGPVALPAVEIVPVSGRYDYTARYTAGAAEFFVPARLDPAVLDRAADVALTAHRRLGLRDLSRTDLIVDAGGTPWFLEVNVAPGMTETSLLPQAATAAGIGAAKLYGDLVSSALARGGRRPVKEPAPAVDKAT